MATSFFQKGGQSPPFIPQKEDNFNAKGGQKGGHFHRLSIKKNVKKIGKTTQLR